MTALFHSAFGACRLERRPPTPGQPLQAWDAADEYLLQQAALRESCPTLLINDQFGALAVALHQRSPHSWSDSRIAQLALQENLARNNLPDSITFVPATAMPAGRYALVLWRIPKSLSLLRQQAVQLHGLLGEDTLVLAGGMIKHLPEQALAVLRELGTVEVLPAAKKARVFQLTPQPSLPAPRFAAAAPVMVPEFDLQLSAGPAVFAHDKLDIGARFFLEQLTQLPKAERIADLGCGNGVLGTAVRRLYPDAGLSFFDESAQAIAAAEANYQHHFDSDSPPPQFHWDDCMSHYRGAPFDLILCNPPFHQSHTIGDQIAWRMFTHSSQHLRRGGELWIVGNRHLNYHVKLKRVYGNCRQVAANPKFVVLAARKA